MSAKPKSGAEPTGKGKSKKKLLVLAIPLLLVALGAGLWFGGVLPPLLGIGAAAKAETAKAPAEPAPPASVPPKPPVFVDLPDIVANLNAGPRRNVFLKLHVKLQIERAEDEATVTASMPKLLDLFQTYLRDMRPEELRGSEGTYRLREELIARASLAAAPARIVDVLFTEMLVQ